MYVEVGKSIANCAYNEVIIKFFFSNQIKRIHLFKSAETLDFSFNQRLESGELQKFGVRF